MLSRLVDGTEVKGLVGGKVVDRGTSHPVASLPTVTGSGIGRCEIVTDYTVLVTGWLGKGPAPYQVGSHIRIRVMGGTWKGFNESVDGASTVSAGMTLFALVSRYTTRVPGVLSVANLFMDVWPVTGGYVTSEGDPHYRETVAAFAHRVLPA